MAAAALQVSVGSFSDGDVEGLAHFCEHMCFLGTEKFPDENSFSAFLNENGGSSNAYTANEVTNYQFDLAAGSGKLREALERFASFFSCPLFTESATGRELNAVDSEHAKNLQNDGWRGYQLDKATSAPGANFAFTCFCEIFFGSASATSGGLWHATQWSLS
jgi:insulysin